MHTRLVTPRHGPQIIVRPLRNGDTATVLAVFARLGAESRRQRFHGPKPCLREDELRQLARVDEGHHALVAWVVGDPRRAGSTEITALTTPDNPAALALVKRIARVVDVCFEGPELSIRAAIA